MRDEGTTAAPSSLREQRLEPVQMLVGQLREKRDLRSLALIAELSLRELRQLAERPVTCSVLDEMLSSLEQLNLDEWEMEEE